VLKSAVKNLLKSTVKNEKHRFDVGVFFVDIFCFKLILLLYGEPVACKLKPWAQTF
jgi:hypothetical protein